MNRFEKLSGTEMRGISGQCFFRRCSQARGQRPAQQTPGQLGFQRVRRQEVLAPWHPITLNPVQLEGCIVSQLEMLWVHVPQEKYVRFGRNGSSSGGEW